jgi:hypothetical protein
MNYTTDSYIYNGEIFFNQELSEQELAFLNDWQATLLQHFTKIFDLKNEKSKDKYYQKISDFVGFDMNSKQMWLIEFSFNPAIHFEKNKIVIQGNVHKGQIIDALMLYHHFFFSEDAFMLKYKKGLKDIMKPHMMTEGFIEATKNSVTKGISHWCYIVKNSDVFSVSAHNIQEYNLHPSKYRKEEKQDKTIPRMNQYFPKNLPQLQKAELDTLLDKKSEILKKNKI